MKNLYPELEVLSDGEYKDRRAKAEESFWHRAAQQLMPDYSESLYLQLWSTAKPDERELAFKFATAIITKPEVKKLRKATNMTFIQKLCQGIEWGNRNREAMHRRYPRRLGGRQRY